MTKVDIFSGFLGAGKTTLIKKLIAEAYEGERLVLIENEFGDIGIDGGFLKESGVQVNEMNSGCICCSLVGDFRRALGQVLEQFQPERILIEPSGVGKLSDIIKAVQDMHSESLQLNGFTTVVDAKKCKLYMKNFGEFFNNQVEHASTIILSHQDGLTDERIDECVRLLRMHNTEAEIITTSWDQLDGKKILATMENRAGIKAELDQLRIEMQDRDHHDHEDHGYACDHDHHDHDGGEPHHHDHEDHGCDHDHHDQDGGESHHHDHDHDGGESHHHHDHAGHHHADEIFQSVGLETGRTFSEKEIREILSRVADFGEYGQIIRAKGIVRAEGGGWYHFDYVPGETDIRLGTAETTGMICVIGCSLEEERIRDLFLPGQREE